MASPQEYERMDEEELAQLQEAYRKLGQPLPPGLQDELELRPLLKSLEELDDSPSQETAEDSCPTTPSDNPVPNQKEPDHFSASSMNRRQWACILFGSLLLVLSLLFVPTRWRGPYNPVSYSFLFTGRGSIDFGRLFVEWILVVLGVSGLIFSHTKPRTLRPPSEDEPLAANRIGKLWQRKFVIPMVAALAVLMIGTVYYGSRRITRNLPTTEVSKLAGGASITNYGAFVWKAYNGSDFVLTEVKVSISVFDEKGNAIISNRVYRVPAYEFYPQQTKELSADVGFTLAPDPKWQWSVVGAKGRPE
jgi:hypothetical protein